MEESDPLEPWLTVGDVARRAGLSVRTLHHYDSLGLLTPEGRSSSGYRLYSRTNLHRLLQIQHLKGIGLSLEEVGAALAAEDMNASGVLEGHIVDVERRIADERRLLSTLRALRTPAENGWKEVLSAVEQTTRLRHPDASVRFRAALGSTAGTPLADLIAQLAAEPEPGVREVLTWAVARHGPSARDALLPFLSSTDPVVRTQGIHALSKIGDVSAVPQIVLLLEDPSSEVAVKAAQALGHLGGPDAQQALVNALGRGSTPFNDAAVDALETADPSVVGLLLPRLNDPSPTIRACVAEVLGLIAHDSAAPTLGTLLEDADSHVRFEAIVALGQLPGGAATTLIDEARTSSDERLRHVAARLLRDRRTTPDR